MSIDAKIPQIKLPAESGKYKVVQFYVGEKPYLRFGGRETKDEGDRHNAIVKRFAEEAGLKTIVDTSLKIVRVFPADEAFKIAGMGWCELNLEKKTAEYYGTSANYYIRIDETHLKSIKTFSQGIDMTYNPRRYS